MNKIFTTLLLFSLVGCTPLLAITWYTQGNGMWGDGGTPGLFNTMANGSGVNIDGNTAPTASNIIIIQTTHQIELTNFAALSNNLDIESLTVEMDASLFGNINATLAIHGSTVTVDGMINIPTLAMSASTTANFNNITGDGNANLLSLSFRHTLPNSGASIDVDMSLQSHFNPLDVIGNATLNPLTIEKNRTLSIAGDLVMDGDFFGNFASNSYDLVGKVVIDGSVNINGDLYIANNNGTNQNLTLQINTSGSLKLNNGVVFGATSIAGRGETVLNVEGTLESLATDPIQDISTRFYVRMNTDSKAIFSGSANQLIDGDVVNATYYNVTLAGTGPKLLHTNTIIENDLELGTMLEIGNFDLDMQKVFTSGFFGGPFPFVGYSASTYVETNGTGAVIAYIPAASFGASNTPIPVGNGSYTQIIATNISGQADYFSMRVANGVNEGGSPITTDYVDKTWYFTPVNSFSGTLNIQFYWNASDEQPNFNRNACWGSHYNGTNWDMQTPIMASSFGGQHNVVRSNTTAFGPFAIASTGLLPVELTSFSVKAQDQHHLLRWETASESNNSHFNVTYSTDGLNFRTIGKVPGQGTSHEPIRYTWSNRPLQSNLFHYYRLEQVDLDGSIAYSEIVSLKDRLTDRAVKLFPTLAQSTLHVHLPEERTADSMLRIFSASGQQLWQQQLVPGQTFQLLVDTWPSGIYFVTENGHPVGRFIKE